MAARGARSVRRRAPNRGPPDPAALGQVEIYDGLVLNSAIVPDQHVARLPPMPVDEVRTGDVVRERGDERLALGFFQLSDMSAVVPHYVEALVTRAGVGADNGVLNWRIAVDGRLIHHTAAAAASEVENTMLAVEEPLHLRR